MQFVEDSEVAHVVDSHHGIYSAQEFAFRWGSFLKTPEGKRPMWLVNEIAVVQSGPDAADYSDAWVGLLDDALVFLDGKRFRIHEDEGIYLVRDDIEWCDECEWFASTDCECPHVQ